MTPLPGFVVKFMPKQFVEAGYHDTAPIGDATEPYHRKDLCMDGAFWVPTPLY